MLIGENWESAENTKKKIKITCILGKAQAKHCGEFASTVRPAEGWWAGRAFGSRENSRVARAVGVHFVLTSSGVTVRSFGRCASGAPRHLPNMDCYLYRQFYLLQVK